METCGSHRYNWILKFHGDQLINCFLLLLLTIYSNFIHAASISCSLDELSSCFRRVFHQFNRSRIFDCDDFRIFRYCYDNPSCSANQTASIASKIYFETASTLLPKEFFTTLYSKWNSKCARRKCEKYDESNCRKNMLPTDKDFDHALLLEWHGQRLQYELGMVPSSRGCSNLRVTMSRWHMFRLSKCPVETALCYCKDQQNRLESCSLNCNALTNSISSKLTNYKFSHHLILCFYVFYFFLLF